MNMTTENTIRDKENTTKTSVQGRGPLPPMKSKQN